jgi:hypothetical protein
VPEEETLADIRERVKAFNAHGEAYKWKALLNYPGEGHPEFAELDMGLTLEANGLKHLGLDNERDNLGTNVGAPAIHLYWTDTLAVA